MEKQKDIRLNANKRTSLKGDFRRHLESIDSPEKEDYYLHINDLVENIQLLTLLVLIVVSL